MLSVGQMSFEMTFISGGVWEINIFVFVLLIAVGLLFTQALKISCKYITYRATSQQNESKH
jgi:hypothetical protein